MNLRKHKAAFFFVGLVLLVGAVTNIDAQTLESPNNTSVSPTEKDDLVKLVDEDLLEISRLKIDIAAATAEDRKILENRLRDRILVLADDVRKAAAFFLKQKREGIDTPDDQRRVGEMLKRLSPLIRDYIDQLDASLVELRERRDQADPDKRAEIEEQISAVNSRLDKAFSICLEHKVTSQVFELDTAAEQDFLETRLAARAELLAGRIGVSQDHIGGLERRLQADPENAKLKAEVFDAKTRLDRFTKSLGHMITLMDSLGMETAQYKQRLFEATGEITTSLLSRKVMSGLISSWTREWGDWVSANGGRIVFKIFIFFAILVGFKVLSKVARRVVKKGISASNLDVSALLQRTAVSVTGTLVMIFGFLVALSQFGFEVTPLLAGLGVMGFIVGFALQDTLGNFAAGIMILLYRPYDVGDLIETAGASGKVSDMSLVATTILTLDHQTLVVPNSKIWGDVIKNVTAQEERRVDMVFGISYSDDVVHAERVINEIIDAHPMTLEEPKPTIRLHNLGESSVDFVVRPWAKTEDYWDVYWDVTREIKMRFDREGISIPFPQRDIHVKEKARTGRNTSND